ncbi:MAG: hypothetical protein AAF400_02785 [Bacteroidota bacterium]
MTFLPEINAELITKLSKQAECYAAKACSRQVLLGQSYGKLAEVIFLATTNHIAFPEKSAARSAHIVLARLPYEGGLKDLGFACMELPEFAKQFHKLSNITER